LTGIAIARVPHDIAAALAVQEVWRLVSWALIVYRDPAGADAGRFSSIQPASRMKMKRIEVTGTEMR
jgi:hypothetical protein